ncbi:MAG TPA: hypothetical protein VKV03_05510 [Candidatus Binataceae bacterium]|nr:hypothetical protein [Candidatus Binataceae bacterium]
MTKVTRTSSRKADSNRRNAAKSTGPRTARGKSRSRLNAMKHGILASQAVIATMEGHAERKLFEATVEGLERDFQPEGTYEQLLVQEIAACFWRKRRLLQFENKAAFDSLDRPASQVTNDPDKNAVWHPAMYVHNDSLVMAEQIYEAAGLDRITLPNERDTMRVIRYEATINRTRERAVAALREMRNARKAIPTLRGASAPAIDRASMRRNVGRSRATQVSPIAAANLWCNFDKIYDEARALLRSARGEAEPIGETNPKKPVSDEKIQELKRILYGEFLGTEPPIEASKASESEPSKRADDPNRAPTG